MPNYTCHTQLNSSLPSCGMMPVELCSCGNSHCVEYTSDTDTSPLSDTQPSFRVGVVQNPPDSIPPTLRSTFTPCEYCTNGVGECCRRQYMLSQGIRHAYTYGTLPPEIDFRAMYDSVCPDGKFEISGDPWINSGVVTADELWELLVQITTLKPMCDKEGNTTPPWDFASTVLTVLGFEWV
jgi:hypothetical protein